MRVNVFNTPTHQYIVHVKEARVNRPQATIEIRKMDRTSISDKFGVITTVEEFEALIPLVQARKEELLKTAHETRAPKGDPYAPKGTNPKMIKVDKAEKVFSRELLDVQNILHAYTRLKRGELTLMQKLETLE